VGRLSTFHFCCDGLIEVVLQYRHCVKPMETGAARGHLPAIQPSGTGTFCTLQLRAICYCARTGGNTGAVLKRYDDTLSTMLTNFIWCCTISTDHYHSVFVIHCLFRWWPIPVKFDLTFVFGPPFCDCWWYGTILSIRDTFGNLLQWCFLIIVR